MKGQRYQEGRRSGKVADIGQAFLADVRRLVEAGPCYVKVGPNQPPGFVARLQVIGALVFVEEDLSYGAQLYEGEPPEGLTRA